MLFAGVFDRCPRLKVGSVEHETMWIPHWLQQMDWHRQLGICRLTESGMG
jgi:hypothetical protein